MNFQTQEQLDAHTQRVMMETQRMRSVNKRANESQMRRVAAELKETFGGIDIMDKKRFDMQHPDFSIRGFQEACFKGAVEGRFRETAPLSAFSALFRGLVNTYANSWYDLTPTVFEEIVEVIPSNSAVEPYAPMARGGRPKRTPASVPSPEVNPGQPMDIQIANVKFTAISSVPKELIMWDKTAQVQQRIQDIGPNMKQYEDAYAAQMFIGSAGSFDGDVIPASRTKPSQETSSTWPWSTAFLGGGANRLASYAAFTQTILQQLDNLLFQQLDPNGNKLVVNPDTLFLGSALRFPGRELLNSIWYPSTATLKVATSTVGADTSLGTSFAQNTMRGLYRPVESRYLPQKAYGIGEAHKGIVEQVASGLTIVQENPMSGKSFDQGEFRFKAEKFWEMDWIDPRFWALGNDGTV